MGKHQCVPRMLDDSERMSVYADGSRCNECGERIQAPLEGDTHCANCGDATATSHYVEWLGTYACMRGTGLAGITSDMGGPAR